jgi:hypothetical protein
LELDLLGHDAPAAPHRDVPHSISEQRGCLLSIVCTLKAPVACVIVLGDNQEIVMIDDLDIILEER